MQEAYCDKVLSENTDRDCNSSERARESNGSISLRPNDSCRAQKILEHRGLVQKVVRDLRKAIPSHVCTEELEAAGILGLIDAVDKYTLLEGVCFHSYAQIRIRGAIIDDLRSTSWVPRSLRKKRRLVASAADVVAHALGRKGDDAEIAAEAGLAIEEYQGLLGEFAVMEIGSLNVVGRNGGEEILAYIPASSGGSPLFQCLRSEFRDLLSQAIASLPKREREIITLAFFESFTSREIASALSISESRVSKLRSNALKLIRDHLVTSSQQGFCSYYQAVAPPSQGVWC